MIQKEIVLSVGDVLGRAGVRGRVLLFSVSMSLFLQESSKWRFQAGRSTSGLLHPMTSFHSALIYDRRVTVAGFLTGEHRNTWQKTLDGQTEEVRCSKPWVKTSKSETLT